MSMFVGQNFNSNLFAGARAPIDDAIGTFLPLIRFRSIWWIIWLRFLRFGNGDRERVCFRAGLSLQGTCPFFFIESRGLRWLPFDVVLLSVGRLTTFHHTRWVAIDHNVFRTLNAARM
jgi:hypothetical protein